jgi:uncharacterized protein
MASERFVFRSILDDKNVIVGVRLTTMDFTVTCEAAGKPVTTSARRYDAGSAGRPWVILAPGAGADHNSAFMVSFARDLASRGLTVVTFNFPYAQHGRRVPDPAATLESCWRAVITAVRQQAGPGVPLFAGGKSMGGRIASHVAADAGVSAELAGLVFLGYPLHPPGQPGRGRTAHWPRVVLPALFVQGTRDPFAAVDELREVLPRFAGPVTLRIVEAGDHSFKILRSAGRPQDEVHADIRETIAQWIEQVVRAAG